MIKKQQVLEVVTWHLENSINYDQLLRGDREEAQYHYYGQWPRPPKSNRSKHISYDVLDAVESIKAEFIEIFLSNTSPIKFVERTADNHDAAQLAWLYVHDTFTRKNKGSAVLHDVLFDALVMKLGVFKVFWEGKEVRVIREFKDLLQHELDMALARPNISLDDVDVTEDENEQPLFSGTFLEQVDKSKVKIMSVPPENFLLPEQSVDDDEPDFMAERTYPMVAELKKMGYKTKDIEQLEDYYVSDEELARNNGHDTSIGNHEPYPDFSGRQRKIVYRCVIYADFEGDDDIQYYEVIMGRRGPILEINPIDNPGYFWWSPYRIAHKTVGLSIADTTKHIQHSKTTLRRGVIDNVVGSNIPRRLVNTHLLKQINQLTDNRIGGIIETTDVERALKELPPHPINPATFEVLGMLDAEKEQRTGQTKLSQGANAEVVSHQNSADLIQSYARLGKKRISAQAKIFADCCFAPMMLYIAELGVQNESMGRLIPIMGKMLMVNPSLWFGMEFDMDTQVALVPEERKEDATNYLMLHQTLGADPKLSGLYQDANKHAVIGKICDLLGLASGVVLTSPDSEEYMAVKQAEAQAQEVQMAVTKAQTGWLSAQQQSEIEKLMLEAQAKAVEAQNKQLELKLRENEMKMKDALERDKMESSNTVELAKIKQKRDDSVLDNTTKLKEAGIDAQTSINTADDRRSGTDN